MLRMTADRVPLFLLPPPQLSRSYASPEIARLGGIGLITRVASTPSALAGWEADASARDGFAVSSKATPGARRFAWLPIDLAPANVWMLTFIGIDLSNDDAMRQAITDLKVTRAAANVSAEQLVSLTSIRTFDMQNGGSEAGFSIYSTVYDDDPTRVILSMGASLEAYAASINAGNLAVVTVTDHFGQVYTHATGCVPADVVQVLTGVVSVTPTTQWRVDIGQCPSFTDGYIAGSTKRTTAWLIVGAIVAIAVLVSAAGVTLAYVSEKDAKLRISMATHTESSRAHRWIIGYGACVGALGSRKGCEQCDRCCAICSRCAECAGPHKQARTITHTNTHFHVHSPWPVNLQWHRC